MNLALLNPFRQADRIESTLSIPRSFHPPRPRPTNDDEDDDVDDDGDEDPPATKRGWGRKSKTTTTTRSTGTKKSTRSVGGGGRGKDVEKRRTRSASSSGGTNVAVVDIFDDVVPPSFGDDDNDDDDDEAADDRSSSTRGTTETNDYDDEAPSPLHDEEGDEEDDRFDSPSRGRGGGVRRKGRDGGGVVLRGRSASVEEDEDDFGEADADDADADGIDEDDENDDEVDDGSESYWTACYAVSFNRRGSYLSSGHASGLVGVHDFLGRAVCALYRPPTARLGGTTEMKKTTTTGSSMPMTKTMTKKMSRIVTTNHGDLMGGGEDAEWIVEEDDKKITGVGIEGEDGVEEGCSDNGPTKRRRRGGERDEMEDAASSTDVGAGLVDVVTPPPVLDDDAKAGGDNDTAPAERESTPGGRNDDQNGCGASSTNDGGRQIFYLNGVTSLSWDRHSRTLLAGAIGDRNLRLMDNTHPSVAADCTDVMRRQFLAEKGVKDVMVGENSDAPFAMKGRGRASIVAACPPTFATLPPPPGMSKNLFIRKETVSLGRGRLLRSVVIDGSAVPDPTSLFASSSSSSSGIKNSPAPIRVPARRHPLLVLELPQPLGGPTQLHPRDSHAGLACMIDGSLAIFWVPPAAFHEALPSLMACNSAKDDNNNDNDNDDSPTMEWAVELLENEERSVAGNLAFVVPPQGKRLPPDVPPFPHYFITCATFGKNGDVIWAVTKCGKLLAFSIDPSMMNLLRRRNDCTSPAAVALGNQILRPALCVDVPGGAPAWQIIVSRNGKFLLINSADCSLRLYNVEDLIAEFDAPCVVEALRNNDVPRVQPRYVFQDTIAKAPWASCDFYNGEYVCGGCNSYPQPGDNYKLFLWNCITGELVDQLTGPVSSLYSLSCHPTRPFIAVGTSDGLVDVWGARLDWVAFAPDFQALQQNEVYEEREDEFDIVVNDNEEGESGNAKCGLAHRHLSEDVDVDIMAVGKIPAFDSDSEDEASVFYFSTKIEKILQDK